MRALVRPTSRRLAEGELTHIDRVPVDIDLVPVDIDLAEQQWEAYVAALAANGFSAAEFEKLEGCVNCLSVRLRTDS